MDEQHNKLMAYVVDEPELAARELAKLREEAERNRGWCIFCSLVALIAGALFL